jgi:hypothetical protein
VVLDGNDTKCKKTFLVKDCLSRLQTPEYKSLVDSGKTWGSL